MPGEDASDVYYGLRRDDEGQAHVDDGDARVEGEAEEGKGASAEVLQGPPTDRAWLALAEQRAEMSAEPDDPPPLYSCVEKADRVVRSSGHNVHSCTAVHLKEDQEKTARRKAEHGTVC